MNPTTSGVLVFACTLAGVLLGMSVRNRLPSHHLNDDSHRSMKDINGLIGTMTALTLSLMTASAQDSFAKVEAAVQHTATDVVTLDRLLARYGPETTQVRGDLRNAVEQRIAQIWPAEPGARIAQIDANPVLRNYPITQTRAPAHIRDANHPAPIWRARRGAR